MRVEKHGTSNINWELHRPSHSAWPYVVALLKYPSFPAVASSSLVRFPLLSAPKLALTTAMAGPVEVFGAAAGAVQVGDAALRLSRQIYVFLEELRSAREDIQRLRDSKVPYT